MRLHTQNRIMFFVLFILFEAMVFLIEVYDPTFRLEPFMWVLLVFAASLGGSAVAYLAIGEWIRWPLVKTVPHSSGAGEDTEPKYHDWRRPPGVLLSCPICAGTWVGMVLLGLLVIYEPLGRTMIYTFSIGGAAALFTRTRETIESSKNVLNELNGSLNRRNIQQLTTRNLSMDDIREEIAMMTGNGKNNPKPKQGEKNEYYRS